MTSQSQTVEGVPEYVAAPAPFEAIVDAWFVETFHNLALPSDLQNRLADARERLKARLRAKEL